ncbi:uncharacterized protein LOC126830997 isoform X2 [Patella vulgata]|uniref:uncharacterized protein LOC126830997 isoform X2 n=1 Tax=Patella vulgata TaxID=6465 RepID=UPI00217F49E5|nr:uncharacterized protein LOC126830997 isoform X2 [Patella vulgata]
MDKMYFSVQHQVTMFKYISTCIVLCLYHVGLQGVFNADLVAGQTNNVLSEARFNITMEFNPNEMTILWFRDTTLLRDARVDTTGSGCKSPLIVAPARFNFYCQDYGGRYILELNSSDVDQGIIYGTDTPSSPFQYEVIDQDHTAAITDHAPPELKDSIPINCTVACTPQETSITVHLKQNNTTYPLDSSTIERKDCSAIGFQTITVTSNVTSQFVQSHHITGSFTIIFRISYGGVSITRETSAIEIVSGLLEIETTTNPTSTATAGVTVEITTYPDPLIDGGSANVTCTTSEIAIITKDGVQVTLCNVSTAYCNITPDSNTSTTKYNYNRYYTVSKTSDSVTVHIANVSKDRDNGTWKCETLAGEDYKFINVTGVQR